MNSALNLKAENSDRQDNSKSTAGTNQIKIVESGLSSDKEQVQWTPSEKVIDTIRKAVQQDIFGTAAGDNTEILEQLSNYTGLPVENIQTFAGADPALEATVRTFLEPGMEAIIVGPTSSNIKIYADIFGVGLTVHYGSSPFSADAEGLAAMLRESHRMVYIGNPTNPTGTVYTNAEIRYVLDSAPTNTLILVDESYCTNDDYSASELIRRFDNLIVVRSFSNVYGLGGLPFGYILASPDNIRMIERLRTGRKSSALTLAAASAILQDMEYISRRVEQIRDNMIFLSVRLRSLGISIRMTPSDFILIRVARPDIVFKELVREGISAVDISHFKQLDNYIKVTVRDDENSARLVELFENMPVELYRMNNRQSTKVTLHRVSENGEDAVSQQETAM